MRYHRIFLLSVLAAIPLAGLAMPHSPRWGEMSSKHSWAADLYIALKSHGGENTLIDALYEAALPVVQSTSSPLRLCSHVPRCSGADMVYTCPGSRFAKLVCCSAPAHCPFLARVLIPSSSHVQTVAQNARSGRYPAT
ncbi:hypothetical protein EDB85DRAFT_2007711, partial [Lactarius pseudohatsudake]